MSSTRKNFKWIYLPIMVAVCFVVAMGAVIIANAASQNRPHIPPCEAMRPYIEYQGITYFEQPNSSLTSADLGNVVTSIGDGTNQAKSCLDAGAPVHSVKGYPSTARLAVGLTLFESDTSTPTPSSSTSPAK